MTAPLESTAVMTDRAAADDTPPAGVDPRPPPRQPPASGPGGAPVVVRAASPADGAQRAETPAGQGEQSQAPRSVSPNAVIGLLGTLLVASLGAMTGLMMWQMDSLGDRIDRIEAAIVRLDAKIDTKFGVLDAKIDTEVAGLRAEMQAGFRQVNATLLDHTDRLARLETAAGLPRLTEREPGAAEREPGAAEREPAAGGSATPGPSSE